MSKVILITGASSGMGYQTAEALAKQGHKVYGAARRVDRMEPLKASGVVPVKMDVTDEASIDAGLKQIIDAEGRIDVLINNAGYGSYGTIEDVKIEEARKQFEVNVFGLSLLIQKVLPYMRAQRSGRIINTSSMGGRLVSFLGGWYHATKYAVEALSEDIRAKALIFSLKAIEDSIYLQRRIWKNIQYVAENPVFRPTEEEWQILRNYYEVFKTSGRSDARYQQDIVTHLLRSLILEFLLMTDNQLVEAEEVAQVSHNPQVLLSRFTEELGKSEGKIRSVEAFAEILHVTPRQLSSAIKTASGRNAMDWIHENTAKIIARELKYSDKTIQDICNDLDFVGLQSFGKFCRQNPGMAPREFRNKYRS